MAVLCKAFYSITEVFHTEECQNINGYGSGALLRGLVYQELWEFSLADFHVRDTLSKQDATF